MPRRVSGWDSLRAWRFIRASKAYRQAWDRRNPTPGLPERAPFPVRLRTAADTGALRWGMLAWEDPRSPEPLAPFWTSAGVIDGRVEPDGAPLVRLAAEGGANLSGLRLDDGALMLRIEQPGRSMQVRLPAGCLFPEDGGLRLVVEREVVRIEDVWLGLPVPRPGRGRGTTGTASFCWRWRARRRGSPGRHTRRASSSRTRWPRTTGTGAGCRSASSAGTPAHVAS